MILNQWLIIDIDVKSDRMSFIDRTEYYDFP